MQTISDNINKMFQNLFLTKKNIHPFFKDLDVVYELKEDYLKNIKEYIKKTITYKETQIPEDIKVDVKYEELDIYEMNKLSKEINNILNFEKISYLVSFMSKFMLKSNITNENKLYNKIMKKNDKVINIMIIGSGPVGLFLAIYLHIYYNKTKMTNYPNVNIVMYDSRIVKPGFRKPYNRRRVFSTNSKYLNMIIPKLYCWSNTDKDYIMINIFILEYILYTIAYNDYNIPMIYDNYSWDDYKKIIEKGDFDVVFDCTGGRLKHDIIKINKSDLKWINNIKLYNNKINRHLDIDIDKNLVLLNHDSKHIDNYFYGSMVLYNNDETVSFYKSYDIDINNKEDLMYLNKVKEKYYTYDNAIKIIRGIMDDDNRNLLYTLLIENNKDYLVSFDVWGVNMRHEIKISSVFKNNNKDILFIGAGDTIFHSHFLTGAGLNRVLDFTVKCANMLDRIVTL